MNEDMFGEKMIDCIHKFAININKMNLNKKEHIKKYNHLRKVHEEIINNMQGYIFSSKYDLAKQFNEFTKILKNTHLNANVSLNTSDSDDITIFIELYVYKHHPNIQSITEHYLNTGKFRNDEKVKMLNSMNNSIVSLFKIISADSNEGYVVFEDVFTKRRYRIIDIAMSSTFNLNENSEIYRYDRLITYDDITFATGIHCTLTKKNNKFKDFLKNRDNKKNNDIVNCLALYDISKSSNDIRSNYNIKFGRY